MSELLRLLTKSEQIARFLSKLLIRSFFLLKTSNLLGKPMSEFPALNFLNFVIKYLGEIETEFKNTLACLSGT